MSNLTKTLTLFTCLLFFSLVSKAQYGEKYKSYPGSMKAINKPEKVSKPDYSTPSDLPADFPKYVDTGNPDADMEKYQQEKSTWYASHPEKAKEFLGDQSSKKTMTKAEFDALPDKRKDYVKAHPERYEVK